MIPSNPARGLKLPRRGPAVRVYLTVDQLRELADESGDHAPLVWLLGTVGLRWGEAAGLQVADINFLRGRIAIKRNVVWVRGTMTIGTPKSHERRTVAVTRHVLDMLEPLTRGKGPDEWIWMSVDGGPMRKANSHGGWFAQAVRRVQARDPGFPRITPHGLRHVAAGLLVSNGANVKVVQRQLGHASAAMTLDTYADLFDGDLEDIVSAMDRALARPA